MSQVEIKPSDGKATPAQQEKKGATSSNRPSIVEKMFSGFRPKDRERKREKAK